MAELTPIRNGLHFEQTTSLNTALQNAGFIIDNHFEVYDRKQLLGYSINQDEFSTIFLKRNGINDRAINSKQWKSDEATKVLHKTPDSVLLICF